MVDYNSFAKTFSQSRKNMKWEEIDYFLESLNFNDSFRILDIWCGNWRFLWALKSKFPQIQNRNYNWIDLSSWLLEEAKKLHNDFEENFSECNMLNIDWINNKYTDIFFIASFHHLQSLEERVQVITKAYEILGEWGKVYMTNWALNSELNSEKYSKYLIVNSKNSFWSLDYDIKIWDSSRFYHCFDVSELEYLAKNSWFKIIENRLFDNKRNFITVLEK